VRFVTQLWDNVDPYRVLSYRRMWLAADEQLIPNEILTEHEQIVIALERNQHVDALRLLERHRARSEAFLAALLDRPLPQSRREGVPTPA
jgi:DNA-binding GntR family transcriptional regulator